MKWAVAFRAQQLLLEVGIRTAVEASERLSAMGYPMKDRSMQRLYSGETKRIDFELIAALCELAGAVPGDLFKLIPQEKKRQSGPGKPRKTAKPQADIDREVAGPVVRPLRKVNAL